MSRILIATIIGTLPTIIILLGLVYSPVVFGTVFILCLGYIIGDILLLDLQDRKRKKGLK